MPVRSKTLLAILLAAPLMLFHGAGTGHAQQTPTDKAKYQGTLTKLGILPQMDVSLANGISADGRPSEGYLALYADAALTPKPDPKPDPTPPAKTKYEGKLTGLGVLPQMDASLANGISADGTTVVGLSSRPLKLEAFMWRAGKMTGLGHLEDWTVRSDARGVSADGSVIIGSVSRDHRDGGPSVPVRWVNGKIERLPIEVIIHPVSNTKLPVIINDVSGNGKIIVGNRTEPSKIHVITQRAFTWTDKSGLNHLENLKNNSFSNAVSISADGRVIAGSSGSSLFSGRPQAVRWVDGKIEPLGYLPVSHMLKGIPSESVAHAVSTDGSTIVGESTSSNVDNEFYREAFLWKDGKMIGLGDLPGGPFNSKAYAVSGNGRIVVGVGILGAQSEENWPRVTAFRWTKETNMQSLETLLSQAGVDLTGINLFSATGISADGRLIVGNMLQPGNKIEGYLALYAAATPTPKPDPKPETKKYDGMLFGLGDLQNGGGDSNAMAVSGDGSAVTGYSFGFNRLNAFRWTEANGIRPLGGAVNFNTQSIATDISADGNAVTGSLFFAGNAEAFRWTKAKGIEFIGNVNGRRLRSFGINSFGAGISDDGNVVVGYLASKGNKEAFRWTQTGELKTLGHLSDKLTDSQALGVSGNGQVVVGQSLSGKGVEAFRWTAKDRMRPLGDLAGGAFKSIARAANRDGRVIVGEGTSGNGKEAFRWSEKDGMKGLGDLPGGAFDSIAKGVSDDGAIIVGQSAADKGHEAFRWTQAGGMKALGSLLAETGVDMAGVRLKTANDISGDGRFIVGAMLTPTKREQAYLALYAPAPEQATPPQNRPTSLTGLGDLPGGAFESSATSVSDNANVVVGWGTTATGTQAFRWTQAGGMQELGNFSGSIAVDVSRKGDVIAGTSSSADGFEAFRWTQIGDIQKLGYLPGGSVASFATAISADGSTVVGHGFSGKGWEAFRWTEAGGMQGLGFLSEKIPSSLANGVSGDGNVVVGRSFTSKNRAQAFRWTPADGLKGIGDLPGGAFESSAENVSDDGNVVIGVGTSNNGKEAFRWTEKDGMKGLGDLPGGAFDSTAKGISSNGGVIVGNGTSDKGQEAFRWSEEDGMNNLGALLASAGVKMTGIVLEEANAVSADGRSIVGAMKSGKGKEAYLAIYAPTPPTSPNANATPTKVVAGLMSFTDMRKSAQVLTRGSPIAANIGEDIIARNRPKPPLPAHKTTLNLIAQDGNDRRFGIDNTFAQDDDISSSLLPVLTLPQGLSVGLGPAFGQVSEKASSPNGKTKIEADGSLVYLGYRPEPEGPSIQATVTRLSLDGEMERGYRNGNGRERARGRAGGSHLGISARVDWTVAIGERGEVTPFATLRRDISRLHAYDEQGGVFSGHVSKQRRVTSSTGLGVAGAIDVGAGLRLRGEVALRRHEERMELPTLSLHALPGMQFGGGVERERYDTRQTSLGLSWQPENDPAFELEASVSYTRASGPSGIDKRADGAHGRLTLSYRF